MVDSFHACEGGPLVYRCTQGVLFVKRSEDPAHNKIVKVTRPVGQYVYSTGWLWVGPNGGAWAEFDASKGEMGWVLVQGPGFGLRGPALMDIEEWAEQDTVSVAVQNLGSTARSTRVVFEAIMHRDSDVGFVKRLLCEKTGLSLHFCCLSKDGPGKIADESGREFMLSPSFMRPLDDVVRLRSLGSDHVSLYLVFTGGLEENVLRSKTSAPVEDDRDSECSDDVEEPKRCEAVKGPKYGGYHAPNPEIDDSDNRTDFEGHNMEPTIIVQKSTNMRYFSPRSSSLLLASSKRDSDSDLTPWEPVSGRGWPNSPRRGGGYGIDGERSYAMYPHSREFIDDFDDSSVPFGTAVSSAEIPDLGYGDEIEWIDAD